MSRSTDARAVGRRYARALLDVVLDGGDPGRVRDELGSLARLFETRHELRDTLDHPALPADTRDRLVEAVFASRGLAEVTLRLVRLLAGRRRLGLMSEIEAAYAEAWNAHRGVVSARAETATRLDESQQAALRAGLERLTGRGVELRIAERPTLLGGLRVHLEGRVYDGTVRARLAALRAALAGA